MLTLSFFSNLNRMKQTLLLSIALPAPRLAPGCKHSSRMATAAPLPTLVSASLRVAFSSDSHPSRPVNSRGPCLAVLRNHPGPTI